MQALLTSVCGGPVVLPAARKGTGLPPAVSALSRRGVRTHAAAERAAGGSSARASSSTWRPKTSRSRRPPAPEPNLGTEGLLQEQVDAMKQLYMQMSEGEKQAFLQNLQEQEQRLADQYAAAEGGGSAQQQQQPWAVGSEAGPGPGSSGPAATPAFLDPGEWKRKAVIPKLWDLIVTSLSAGDAAILKKAFPADWTGYGKLSRNDVAQGLRRLTRAERERMPAIMTHVENLQRTATLVSEVQEQAEQRAVLRRRRRAAQMGIELSEETDGEDGGGSSRSARPDPLLAAAGLVYPDGAFGEAGEEGAGEGQATDKEHGSASDGGNGARQQEWQHGEDRQQQPGASTSGGGGGGLGDLPQGVQERLGRMMGTYERFVQGNGWEQEGRQRQSAELRNLIRWVGGQQCGGGGQSRGGWGGV